MSGPVTPGAHEPLDTPGRQAPVVPSLRPRVVALMLCLVWTVLAARLVQLHLWSGAAFENLAARQRSFREEVPARPGDIVDREGRVFATSVSVRSVFLVPQRITKGWETARKLAEALQLDSDLLFEKIASHPDQQFLWVKRRISDEEVERVRALNLPATTWGFREEFRRYYPQGELAAHVIGMRDIDGNGQGGIEQSCQKSLRGKDGYRELIRDARGRVLEIREEQARPPQHGQTVTLTLDATIQVFAELALDDVLRQWKPQACCALVLDPKTGEVLAMASRPTFNPNSPERIPPEAWKNRTIADIYEPGSTFKPFVVAWALQHKLIQQDEIFHCENGEYRMGRRVLHDHHPYGKLNVTDILVKSSNIGMAKIGERMTNPRLYESAVVFGFGGPTGIELPGELSGILRPLKKWNAYSTGSIPMGQEISTTPLQILAGYGALANGGKLLAPHLLRQKSRVPAGTTLSVSTGSMGNSSLFKATTGVNDSGHVIVSQAVDPAIAEWVRTQALTAVVTRGTGKKAFLKGYQVFGKSGTAQKLDVTTGQYSNQLHLSSFVCGAPAHDPRVLVLVAVDEPSVGKDHFGGSVAAPAAGEILRKTLHQLRIPPSDKLAALEGDFETQLE